MRSEERRVGKECRSMWETEHSSRRRHTRLTCDWSSDVCSSDLMPSAAFADQHSKGDKDQHKKGDTATAGNGGIGGAGGAGGVAGNGGENEVEHAGGFNHQSANGGDANGGDGGDANGGNACNNECRANSD